MSGASGQSRAALACRGCARKPVGTRTPVGRDAIAYTCSRCLMGGHQGVDSGSQKPAAPSVGSSGTSNTVFRYGRAGKSGRPRVAIADQRRKARERVRAYRARQKNSVPGKPPDITR
jgi:hypothetical protein